MCGLVAVDGGKCSCKWCSVGVVVWGYGLAFVGGCGRYL